MSEVEDEKSIRQALALLTRKLISEDDELELLNIYRETQRLRAVLETLQADKSVEAPVKTNIKRRQSSRRPGHPGSNRPQSTSSAHSAHGMLSRCLYLPAQAGVLPGGSSDIRESETDIDVDDLPASNDAPESAADTSDLPPPPPDASEAEVSADLSDMPPPPDATVEGADTAESTAATGEAEDEEEFFFCSAPECGQEAYGKTDDRDGHFYCHECWNEYHGVGDEDKSGAGADTDAVVSVATTAPAKPVLEDINDPAHPDYWANLKKTLDGDDANPQSDSKQLADDVFAQTVRNSSGCADQGTAGASGGDDAQLNEVMEVMLERIQDKRKSIRYEKKKRLGFFGKREKQRDRGSKVKLAKQKKKKKIDPAELLKMKMPLPATGIFVRNPSNAIPLAAALVTTKAKKKKKPAVPPPLFGTEVDGTVTRDVYTYDEDALIPDAYAEPVVPADQEWIDNGLPVRNPVEPFILKEFGGVNDPNYLAGCNALELEGTEGTEAPAPPKADY